MKRMISAALAVAMVFAMSTTAFAGGHGRGARHKATATYGQSAVSHAQCGYGVDCPGAQTCLGYHCTDHEDCPLDATCDYYNTFTESRTYSFDGGTRQGCCR